MIRNFQDQNISTALPVIDLIDAIKPGSISYGQILAGNTPQVRTKMNFNFKVNEIIIEF